MKTPQSISKKLSIKLSNIYDDIYSVEYKGVLYINTGYNRKKYGNKLFDLSI